MEMVYQWRTVHRSHKKIIYYTLGTDDSAYSWRKPSPNVYMLINWPTWFQCNECLIQVNWVYLDHPEIHRSQKKLTEIAMITKKFRRSPKYWLKLRLRWSPEHRLMITEKSTGIAILANMTLPNSCGLGPRLYRKETNKRHTRSLKDTRSSLSCKDTINTLEFYKSFIRNFT